MLAKARLAFIILWLALEEKELGKISRVPVSIWIVLESVLATCDGKKVVGKFVGYRTRRQIIGLTEPDTPDGEVVDPSLGTVASRVTAHSQLIGHSFLAASAAPPMLMLPPNARCSRLMLFKFHSCRSCGASWPSGGSHPRRSSVYHFSST
jgi:hypothetical protein